MRNLVTYALVAAWAAKASVLSHSPRQHNHRLLHARKINPKLPPETELTSYTYKECVKDEQGMGHCEDSDRQKVSKCIEDGSCVIVSMETEAEELLPGPVASPAIEAPPQQPPSNPSQPLSLPAASVHAVEPVGQPSSPPAPAAPAASSVAPSAAPSAASSAASSAAPPAAPSKPAVSGDGKCPGVDCEFPSGKYPCSKLPDGFGLKNIYWQNIGGWAGIQKVDDYTPNSNKPVAQISTIDGNIESHPGTFYSYACPPSYQKSQWPPEQGVVGQSIGGLYCNADGLLELIRPSVKTLCQKGVGGVFAENIMPGNISICRTDYPGTERMVIPTVVAPGQKVELTNPNQTEYMWKGLKTTAQYYLNPLGVSEADACVWVSPNDLADKAGDKAPVILGAGYDPEMGQSFLSVFPNNKLSAIDYKIDIIQEGISEPLCIYEESAPENAGKPCTVSIPKGGVATFRFRL